MFYEEDFYNEPSEFDMMVSEFKAALAKSVKNEYVSEMERLKKENESLQEVKEDFETIKATYEAKKHQLEIEKKNLERTVRRERLSSLMNDFQVIMYQSNSKLERPQKCDKCDKHRKVQYLTPLGKKATEDCACSVGKVIHYPSEYISYEFKINRDGNGMSAFYKLKEERDYDYASHDSRFAKVIYNSEIKYESINEYETFFKTKEECQGYCDYLNAK